MLVNVPTRQLGDRNLLVLAVHSKWQYIAVMLLQCSPNPSISKANSESSELPMRMQYLPVSCDETASTAHFVLASALRVLLHPLYVHIVSRAIRSRNGILHMVTVARISCAGSRSCASQSDCRCQLNV